MDDCTDFMARVEQHLAKGRFDAREKESNNPRQRFVALVDSRTGDPKVVAAEVRDLARDAVQAATAAAVDMVGVDGGAVRRELERVVICVLDYRVVAWLKRRGRRRKVQQEGEGESAGVRAGQVGGRGQGKEQSEREHFVCAIHVGGGVVDEQGRVAARVVWRS